jgi:hypothetical protein
MTSVLLLLCVGETTVEENSYIERKVVSRRPQIKVRRQYTELTSTHSGRKHKTCVWGARTKREVSGVHHTSKRTAARPNKDGDA